jgi:hypothetical protein
MSELAMALRPRSVMLLAGALALVSAYPAPASPTFTKIVDTEMTLPGSEGTFFLLSVPALDGVDVAFTGTRLVGSSLVTAGIFKHVDGTLQSVADRETLIPGGSETFDSFGAVSISGGNVAFVGRGASGHEGIYTDAEGLTVVVDTSTPIPGGGEFAYFRGPWLDEGSVAFRGESTSGAYGIYLHNGSLNCIADANTLIPPDNNETFAVVMFPALSGEMVAFRGTSGDGSPDGTYLDDQGTLTCIVDDSTPIPEGSGDFDAGGFGNPSIDDYGNIRFNGRGADDQRGVYVSVDGELGRAVDRSCQLPGFGATVTGFGSAGNDGDVVAFTVKCCATPVGWDAAVYANVRGALCRIIGVGDELDGRTVHQARVGRQSVSGNRIALWVSYNSGLDYAIYLAHFCPGDLDGDHTVDLSDLAELLAHYGTSGTRTQGDINGNGRVGVKDLEILLTNYGTTCSD